MSIKRLAIGFTGNYVENRIVRHYYLQLAEEGYPVTFFHPLRVVRGDRLRGGISGAGSEFIGKLLALGFLEADARNFANRFKLMSAILPPGTHVRIVIHTDYAAPFWCSGTFQDAYLKAIPATLDKINKAKIRRLETEVTVELHPGFTALGSCHTKAGRIYCSTIEKDKTKLASCLASFRERLVEKTSIELGFCIEPRAGSIVKGRRGTEPQTLKTHMEAYLFIKHSNLSLVIDPAQTILKKISIEKVWEEVFGIAATDPLVIEEIHVHSPSRRRAHSLPFPQEVNKFRELALITAENRAKPLGLVLEILGAKTSDLIKVAEKLLKD